LRRLRAGDQDVVRLSAGRLDVGVGHGTNYNEYEFVGFGLRSV